MVSAERSCRILIYNQFDVDISSCIVYYCYFESEYNFYINFFAKYAYYFRILSSCFIAWLIYNIFQDVLPLDNLIIHVDCTKAEFHENYYKYPKARYPPSTNSVSRSRKLHKYRRQ